jgi:membrane-bound inhibitor of C-type lysozyme
MADDITLPLGHPDEDLTDTTEVVEQPEAAAPEPAVEAEPEPEPEPVVSREAQLAAENAQLREWALRLEGMARHGMQPPAPPQTAPDFFADMSPEQRAAWNASVKTLEPWQRHREQQLRQELQAQMDARMQQVEQRFSEAAQLRANTPDFAQREAEMVAYQQQAAQQGQRYTLGQIYTWVKGQEAIQAAQRGGSPRTQATQVRRKAAAQAARPETSAPAGVRMPAPAASPERIKAMSDDEILDAVAAQTGIPRLKIQKRA